MRFVVCVLFLTLFRKVLTSDGKIETEGRFPRLIIVTPTYARVSQAMHITNLVNVLRIVPPPVYWIVVETYKTAETRRLLNRTAGSCIFVGSSKKCSSINYVHLNDTQPHEDPGVSRGVHPRNLALKYIEDKRLDGIVCFIDDDNVYSPQLFQEFRKVKKVGILPVGFIWTQAFQETHKDDEELRPFVQRPLVRKGKDGRSRVYGWETFKRAKWWPDLKFQTDMASFAFRSSLMWSPPDSRGYPKHPIRFKKKLGMLESLFLELLVPDESELEPLADDCQQVWVWHVKFEGRWLPYPRSWRVVQPVRLVPGEYRGSYFLINGTSYRPEGYDELMPQGYW